MVYGDPHYKSNLNWAVAFSAAVDLVISSGLVAVVVSGALMLVTGGVVVVVTGVVVATGGVLNVVVAAGGEVVHAIFGVEMLVVVRTVVVMAVIFGGKL